jgi:hypothetical protein
MRVDVACFIGTPLTQHEFRITRSGGVGLENEVECGKELGADFFEGI